MSWQFPDDETVPDGSVLRVVRDREPPWAWTILPPVLIAHNGRHDHEADLAPDPLDRGKPHSQIGHTEFRILDPETAPRLGLDATAARRLAGDIEALGRDRRAKHPGLAGAWLNAVKAAYGRAGVPGARFSVGDKDHGGTSECLLIGMPDWLDEKLGLDLAVGRSLDDEMKLEAEVADTYLRSYVSGRVWSLELDQPDGSRERRSPPLFMGADMVGALFRSELRTLREEMSAERTASGAMEP